MTSATHAAVLVLVAVIVTGCGSSVRNMLERGDAPDQQTSVRQELTMPPDMRLAPPGSAPAPAAQEAAPVYNDSTAAATAPTAPATSAAKAKYGDDVYTNVGISVYKPDGTRKTDAELRAELQKYYTAKKKQKNPNYGTVFNMGNIFKDE